MQFKNNNHTYCEVSKLIEIGKTKKNKWFMCQNCSLIYSISLENKKNEIIDEQFNEFGNVSSSGIEEFKAIIKTLKRFTEIENLVFFDFGCGDGTFLKIAEEKFKDVIGFEPNKFLRMRSLEKKIKMLDEVSLKNLDQKYDIIFTRNTFPFVQNFAQSINILIKCLRPNGYIIWRDKYWDFFPKRYLDDNFSNKFSSLPLKSTIKHYLKINGIELLISRFYFDDSFLIIGKKTHINELKLSNQISFVKKKITNNLLICSIISYLRKILNKVYLLLRSIKYSK